MSARRLSLLALAIVAVACSSTPPARIERAPTREAPVPAGDPARKGTRPPAYALKRGGGYYQDDGLPDEIPIDLDAIADAEPRWEPLHKPALRPYEVLGKSYRPFSALTPYKERGIASWYGRKFHGKKTSTGESYDMFAMTAAHTRLPLPSYARVTHLASGRSVIVRVNDRGPFHDGRIIDLSYTAAHKLGLIGNGSGDVEVEAILPGDDTGTRYAAVAPSPASPATAAVPPRDEAALGDLLARLDGPAPATAESSVPSPTPSGTYFVQLGAFSSPDNATSLREQFGRELDWLGSDAITIHRAGPLHRVQAGPYASRSEAEQVMARIDRETGFRPALAVR